MLVPQLPGFRVVLLALLSDPQTEDLKTSVDKCLFECLCFVRDVRSSVGLLNYIICGFKMWSLSG